MHKNTPTLHKYPHINYQQLPTQLLPSKNTPYKSQYYRISKTPLKTFPNTIHPKQPKNA